MKKFLPVVLSAAMLLTTLTACGGKATAKSADPGSAAAAGSADKKVSKVSIDAGFGPTLDMPYGQAHEYWAKILKEQSGGSMQINVFPSDQLGSTKDVIGQALTGDAIITSTDVSYFADLGIKDLMIIQAPYLAKSWDQMNKIFNSDWFAEQEKLLEAKGIKVLAKNWRYGDRNTLTDKLVKSPADIKGLKIRVPQATTYVKGFQAIGAAPTPLALPEVYTALQEKTINGLENPLATLYSGKYHEVAKYLLMDAHMKTINIVICGTKFFNTLSADQQKLLMKTAQEAGDQQNKLAADKDAELLKKFKSEGVTVTDINYDEWAQAAKGFYNYPEFSSWTPGLQEKIQNIMNK